LKYFIECAIIYYEEKCKVKKAGVGVILGHAKKFEQCKRLQMNEKNCNQALFSKEGGARRTQIAAVIRRKSRVTGVLGSVHDIKSVKTPGPAGPPSLPKRARRISFLHRFIFPGSICTVGINAK
jgi:hypothetical protein